MRAFSKDTLEAGQPAQISCVELEGQTYTISGAPLRVIRLEEEWYEDVHDPARVVDALNHGSIRGDLFTFWQRIPETEPRFDYVTEWEELAVLPLQSFNHWWDHQIKSRTRNLIRKSEKLGVEVRRAAYDDDFVRGMTAIFNETPVRQDRLFWHYGKDVETVRRQFSRFLFREELIGAYYQGEMIGFMMLADAGRFALTGQILSMIAHREKATNNALIAKAVEVCAERGWSHLVYLHWGSGSFSEFKRRCGFDKVRVPRYYVPLSPKGKLALRLGLHRGWRDRLPAFVKESAKDIRSRWLNHRYPQ
jgi:hypothetical protein